MWSQFGVDENNQDLIQVKQKYCGWEKLGVRIQSVLEGANKSVQFGSTSLVHNKLQNHHLSYRKSER